MERLASGLAGFDALVQGGLPPETSLILQGPPGQEKLAFALAFLATGSSIPWEGLLLAYGAGQLAANLPITPGGLGAVEGSITIALSYFGGATTADIGAVFVYRLVSFWLVMVVGWLWAGGLAIGVRRGRWPRSVREAPGGRVTASALAVDPADPADPADPSGSQGGTA